MSAESGASLDWAHQSSTIEVIVSREYGWVWRSPGGAAELATRVTHKEAALPEVAWRLAVARMILIRYRGDGLDGQLYLAYSDNRWCTWAKV